MIHYSCDRCKRVLDSAEDLRYVVKLEIQAMMNPVAMDETDDDRDHLLEVHEILERREDLEGAFVGEDIYQRGRYDLCPECYRRFIKDPIGAEPAVQLDFSQN
jgi:DNA-directed RNA polymerase subunit RPC12/RpoP